MGGWKRPNGHHDMSGVIQSPNWQPSPFRTIPIATPPSLRIRGLVGVETVLSWAPKSSADALDYTLDPTEWLSETNDGVRYVDAVVTTATGLDTDLKVLWRGPIAGLVVVHLGGGAPGTTQLVNVIVTSLQGRQLIQQIQIAITNATAAAVPPSVLVTDGGVGIPPNAIMLPDGSILGFDNSSPLVIA